MADLESSVQVLKLENESQLRRISELEAWIGCLTESTLVATGGNQMEADELKQQIEGVSEESRPHYHYIVPRALGYASDRELSAQKGDGSRQKAIHGSDECFLGVEEFHESVCCCTSLSIAT